MIQKLKSVFSKDNLLFKHTPDYCELIVTEKCFFKCQMCDMWKRKNEDTPSLEQWRGFLKSFRKTVSLPFKIHICGGETLTYKHLPELIKYATDQGFDVFITTNAFLLDKKMSDKLYRAGLRDIVISLDSYDAKIHDEIRGVKGSYKKVMEAITNLSQYPKQVSINIISIIMSLNLDSILPLVKWAKNNSNVNSINFNAITKPLCSDTGDDWYKTANYAHLWPSNLEKVDTVLNTLIEMKNKGVKIGSPIGQLRLFKKYFKHPELFVKQGKCHMGNTVSVNSEGFIFMCHYFGDIGNIKKVSFENVWMNNKSQDIRKKILQCEKNCKMLINCNYQE